MDSKETFKKCMVDFTERLENADCTNEECDAIWQEIKDKSGFCGLVEKCYLEDVNDFSILKEYVILCMNLASKFGELGNKTKALQVVAFTNDYLPENDLGEDLKKELDELEEFIKTRVEEKVIASEVTKVEAPKNVMEEQSVEKSSSSKKMLLYGGIIAVIITALLFYVLKGTEPGSGSSSGPDPKPKETVYVPVSFDLPQGTIAKLDGKSIDWTKDIKVAVGQHNISLEHHMLEFVYDKQLNISTPGKIALIKEFKLSNNAKNSAEKTVSAMMDTILKQACTSDIMKINPPLFTAQADKNGKITKAHRAMRSYAVKSSIKIMSIEKTSLRNMELISKEGGKSFFIKCPAELLGRNDKAQKLNYTIHTTLKIEGENLAVDSLDSFKAEFAR
ncbi:MAG: hypothetical protein ACI3WT_04730 [Phascolarctobacterium sp.]